MDYYSNINRYFTQHSIYLCLCTVCVELGEPVMTATDDMFNQIYISKQRVILKLTDSKTFVYIWTRMILKPN